MTTDAITTTLDLLAIACIERPNDFAAWAALCDYCEENGLLYHPRALYLVLNAFLSVHDTKPEVDERTKSLAYGPLWNHDDTTEVYKVRFFWALPMSQKVTA